MPKKKIVIIALLSVFSVISIPLAIDWLIIGNQIPSNISDSDWVSFLGGYVGAIIGAAISIISIIVTIRYTNSQNKKDRELQVRPYCSIQHVNANKLRGTSKILGQLPIGCEPQENDGERYTSIIYIKNIGIGPAIEFDFEVGEIKDGRKHYPILMQRNEAILNNCTSLLQPGEEGAFVIYIWFNFDPILESDMEEIEGHGKRVKFNLLEKYKGYDIDLKIKYKDLFQNQFIQMIKLTVQIGVKITKEGVASYYGSVLLKEQSTLKKSKSMVSYE